MRIIFATLLLFAACGHPRCLDVSVHVDTELARISAWIEPPDSEPLECDDRIVCPPEGAPYAETFVTFVREGDTQATLDL